MKNIYLLITLSLIIIFCLIPNVFAENGVFINEFIIEPNPQSVELINIGTESADISNWYIDDSGGSTYFTIPQNTVLYPNSCLTFSSNFYLNTSSSDTVRLIDQTYPPTTSSAKLIDSFSYQKNPGSGNSYFRFPDGNGNWSSGSASLGNFNMTETSCIVLPTPLCTDSPVPTSTPTPTSTDNPSVVPTNTPIPIPQRISYDNIFLSEIMANPETGENEWVEFFNNNDFEVFLDQWYIDDRENQGSSPKQFFLNIPAKSYGVFDLSSGVFNNDGDEVRLLDFNKTVKDSFEYGETMKGKTLGRESFESDEFCDQEQSKNRENYECVNPTSTPAPTTKPTATIKVVKSTVTKIPTITPIKNVKGQMSNVKSISQNSKIQNKTNTSSLMYSAANRNNENILGVSTMKPWSNRVNLLFSLLFISFSFSLLTIGSVFLKMKTGYAKIH